MKHILILTGGYLNIDFAREYMKTLSYDKVFAVDKGLEYADVLGVVPDYLVGDFDTVDDRLLALYEDRIERREIITQIERHPAMKDATDTELALENALELHPDCITILGATGSRMDHVLANIGLLKKTVQSKVKAYIVDETNRITMLSENAISNCMILKDEQYGEYVSLVPITPEVRGVTLKGALYPLDDAIIYYGSSLAVSNQIVGKQIEIQIKAGQTLVIESKDK